MANWTQVAMKQAVMAAMAVLVGRAVNDKNEVCEIDVEVAFHDKKLLAEKTYEMFKFLGGEGRDGAKVAKMAKKLLTLHTKLRAA